VTSPVGTRPTPAALRTVCALSKLWNLGLQPGSVEDAAARMVDETTGLPELLATLKWLVEQETNGNGDEMANAVGAARAAIAAAERS